MDKNPSSGALPSHLSPACDPTFPNANTYIANAASFQDNPVGHITPDIESDGIIRSTRAVICKEGKAYPALGIAAIMRDLQLSPSLSIQNGSGWLGPQKILIVGGDGFKAPISNDGRILIPYDNPRQNMISIPAHQILKGNIQESAIKDKIIIIGSSAVSLSDVISTPQSTIANGFEVHAALILGLMHDHVPHIPREHTLVISLISLMGGILILLGASIEGRGKVIATILLGSACSIILVIGYSFVLSTHQLRIDWTFPVLHLILTGMTLSLLEHHFSRKERDLVLANFSSYLPRNAAHLLAFKKPRNQIVADKRPMTVWIADIRNYSNFCEKSEPIDAANLLHNFFTLANRIIDNHGGITESLNGDSIVALWGNDKAGVQRATEAANQLILEWPILNKDNHIILNELDIGIGIETGKVILGSIDPKTRRMHTVLGETVTVADRLQMISAKLLEPILIGPHAASLLPSESIHEIGEFLLEDLNKPRRIFAFRHVNKQNTP